VAAAGGCLVLCLITIVLVEPQVIKVYSWPTSWAACLLVGAAARLGEARLRPLLARGALGAGASAVAGLALVAACLSPEAKRWPLTYLVGAPMVSVCAVVWIFRVERWTGAVPRVLRPVLALGVVSYAAYLWNYPIVTWLGPRPLSASAAVASVLFTVLAATASWWLVERPVARLRVRLDRASRPETRLDLPLVAGPLR
jgi:peptidoglycan/LPS O-acetylase OafA/YrhL